MGDLLKTSPLSTPCLVKDFLHYKLSQKGYVWESCSQIPKPTSVMKALRRIADDFETKNRAPFDEMFANLDIAPDTAQSTFLGVVNELFAEGVTWGRLVAMFAFGGEMAVQCAEKKMNMLLNPLADWIASYVDDQLANWIEDNGGWEAFKEFCQITDHNDDSKPGLKRVAWGLAVGVIGALTVGAILTK